MTFERKFTKSISGFDPIFNKSCWNGRILSMVFEIQTPFL